MLKIGITGCAGRMGRMLVAEILASDQAVLAGGCEQENSPFVGQDLTSLAGFPASGVLISNDPGALFAASDVVIDFTTPAATITHALLAGTHNTAMVIGTTGLIPDALDVIRAAGNSVPMVYASNFSIGVNVLLELTKNVASRLGVDYDIEVVEMHHRHKVDAPSGTALSLGMAAAEGRGISLENHISHGRHGHTGERVEGSIGFASLRGGDVVGDHTVVFAGLGERVELTHKASSRDIFAKGAVRAALWTAGRPAGFYGMPDVLGFTG